ncbi:MAG: hypothetical protein ABGX23_06065 [Nautiliaceae bacterium]
MKLNLKNRLDLLILISGGILVISGAFLRFFKYLFTPYTLTSLTYILIPETIISLLTIKFLKDN